jgi:hypothetical protein
MMPRAILVWLVDENPLCSSKAGLLGIDKIQMMDR